MVILFDIDGTLIDHDSAEAARSELVGRRRRPDDRRDVYAEAARSAGMRGIWLGRYGLSTDGALPWRIRSLTELPAALMWK